MRRFQGPWLPTTLVALVIGCDSGTDPETDPIAGQYQLETYDGDPVPVALQGPSNP